MSTPESAPRPKVGALTNRLARGFEVALYAIAVVGLAVAAVLMLIGGVKAVIHAAALKSSTLEAGVLLLDHILLILIIAELAYTIRSVQYHEIQAEPFLYVGLIATIRRILIVTAQLEQPRSDQAVNRLLLQLGVLALLVLAIAAAIFLVRYSARRAEPGDEN
jgi:hypothetical protein